MRRLSALVRLAITLALGGVVVALTAILVGPQIGTVATSGEWSHSEVNLEETAVRSLVYDSRNNLMASWYRDNRSPISIDLIPDKVIQAVIAIEDADFYRHDGVNFKATGRALVENVDAGGISQGGSTITQQLIKNLVLSTEQTIERKVQEAALAVRLEDQMSKDQILEQYLNTVYFGSTAYGVKAAAEVYFGLDTANASDEEAAAILDEGLGWPEAALLASLISNPSANDPIINPETSRYQRRIVLDRMAELELITQAEAEQFSQLPLPTERNELSTTSEGDYFLQEVRRLLLEDETFLGGGEASREETLLAGGLRIYTSYDPRSQRQAEAARDQVLRGEDPNNPIIPDNFTMSIAAVDPRNGAVRAMVGGESFEENKFNIALHSPGRQTGSSFKTFTLVAALRQGHQTNDTVNGAGPCKFENDEFENFGGSRGSLGTVTSQTLASSNCGYVRISLVTGLDNVIETAGLLGADNSKMLEVRSLTLGAFEVTPMDMAESYATIASGGVHHEPYFIERIEDADGNVLYDRRNDERFQGNRVISKDIACWATDVLAANVRGGTGTGASLPNQVAAGKTGTAEDFTNAWFVGYTPYLATAVWMGDPLSNNVQMTGIGGLGGVTGGTFPAAAYRAFNTAYHENLEPVPFPSCPGFARPGEFLKVEGDVSISTSPCGETDEVVVLVDGEEECRDRVPPRGEACGDSGYVDDVNEPIPVYCVETGRGDDDDGGADGGGGDTGADGGGGDGGADGGGDGGADGGADGGGADGGGADGGGADGGGADGGGADGGGADGGADSGGADGGADGGGADGGADTGADGGADTGADGGADTGAGGADDSGL